MDYQMMPRPVDSIAPAEWTNAEVLGEVDRITGSPIFARSVRLSRFLVMTVKYLLEGRAEMLKEYTVGTEVYERGASYDPIHDSIVRTEARRLRTKLEQFYLSDHSSRAVTIRFVAGSYVPIITRGVQTAAEPDDSIGPSLQFRGFDGPIRLAVSLFRASGADFAAHDAARDFTDEMTYRLAQRSGLTVFRPSSDGDSDSSSQLRTWRDSGVSAVLDGSVRACGSGMTTTVHLSAISGMILWAQRFEMPYARDGLGDLCAGCAEAIVNRLKAGTTRFPELPAAGAPLYAHPAGEAR